MGSARPKVSAARAKRREEAVQRMKKARGLGEASFRVHLCRHEIKMVVQEDQVVANATLNQSHDGLYGQIFEVVKSMIEQAENADRESSPRLGD